MRWDILWDQRQAILTGFRNTLILFSISAIVAFALSCVAVLLIQTRKGFAPLLVRGWIDSLRMLPFLLYAYILYYGLPTLGIRLDAWSAGFIALITYHAAYFAEILRGSWATLPAGQAEAARAVGFVNATLYRRIILPQLIMRAAPVLGNQLIIILKDTAFLSIITVRELTAAASAVQSTYFIPFEAFLIAIILYWSVSFLIEMLVRWIGILGERRGLGNSATNTGR